MADDVRRAVTPGEWEEWFASGALRRCAAAEGFAAEAVHGLTDAQIPAVIALLNDRLPEGHPLKLTRADVALLAVAASDAGVDALFHHGPNADELRTESRRRERELQALAAKLAAYLPPGILA